MPFGLLGLGGPGLYINPYYVALIIISIVIGAAAQSYINKTYARWSLRPLSSNKTGAEIAQAMLEKEQIYDVKIATVAGKLTDNFDPRDNTLHLSHENHSGSSVASVAVACHEAGHAVQNAQAYLPVKVRSALVPLVNLTARWWFYIFVAGVFLNLSGLITLSIILFSFSLLFQVVTLPVEIDASKRALAYIKNSGEFSEEALLGAKEVLIAAALTYFAAALISFLQLLYLLSQKSRAE